MTDAMMRGLPIILGSAMLFAAATVGAEGKPLPTVAKVDLARYLGTWYEVARLPTRFEKDCVGVTATYSKRDDGTIDIVNRCRKKWVDGEIKDARGKAKVVDTATNAKLKVTFFWPFYGDYWIIELGQNYEYALVGEPDREYLWILSRTATLPEATVQALLARAKDVGYDVTKIYFTPQPTGAPAQPVPGAAADNG
jgi:apolipoprotein D and lipocalin family protein